MSTVLNDDNDSYHDSKKNILSLIPEKLIF